MPVKKQSRNFWIYVLLAFIAAVVLLFEVYYHSSHTVTMHAACGAENAQEGDTYYVYHLYGNQSHINEIRLEITRKISEEVSRDEAAAAEQAMEISGEKIEEIRNSEAVTVSYEVTSKEKDHLLLVTITILPEYLASSDYDYLNANNLILFGTIRWNTVTMQEAAGILSSEDSLSGPFDSDLSEYK